VPSIEQAMGDLARRIADHETRVKRLETLEFSTVGFGCFTLIEDILLDAVTSPVTFAAIPQTYRHLMLVLNFQSDGVPVYLRFNGDSGANYDWGGARHGLADSGSPAYQASYFARGYGGEPNTSIRAGGTMEGEFGVGYIFFGDYASSDKNKTMLSHMPIRVFGEGEAPSLWMVEHEWGVWNDMDSLTQIDVYDYIPGGGGGFYAGSRFSLYGLC